jgi:hypothetical protein
MKLIFLAFLNWNTLRTHTGHTVITISSEGEELVHIADTFQHIMLIEHPNGEIKLILILNWL